MKKNAVILFLGALLLLLANSAMALSLRNHLVCGNDSDLNVRVSWGDGTHMKIVGKGDKSCFSPNGRFLAYQVAEQDTVRILDSKRSWKVVKEFPGGMPALTKTECYYEFNDNGVVRIWHQPIVGGEAQQLTNNFNPFVSESSPSAGGRIVQWATSWQDFGPPWKQCSAIESYDESTGIFARVDYTEHDFREVEPGVWEPFGDTMFGPDVSFDGSEYSFGRQDMHNGLFYVQRGLTFWTMGEDQTLIGNEALVFYDYIEGVWKGFDFQKNEFFNAPQLAGLTDSVPRK